MTNDGDDERMPNFDALPYSAANAVEVWKGVRSLLQEHGSLCGEEIAVDVGWETQDGTSVPFDELPQDNQNMMLQLAVLWIYISPVVGVLFVASITDGNQNQSKASVVE